MASLFVCGCPACPTHHPIPANTSTLLALLTIPSLLIHQPIIWLLPPAWAALFRLYIGLSFGLLEPSLLLLVLFAVTYSCQPGQAAAAAGAGGGGGGGGGDPGSNPNLFIFALTLGLTLPMCAAQVFAALFSRIMTQLRYNEQLMFRFFAASASVPEVRLCVYWEGGGCLPLGSGRRAAILLCAVM